MGVKSGPRIVKEGLVLSLDASVSRSYSGSGLTINGLVGGIGGTLVNGTGFSSTLNGSFFFDGLNGYINIPDDPSLTSVNNLSINMWFNSAFSSARYTDLIGKGTSDADEEYTILLGTNSSSMYFDVGGGSGPFIQPSYVISANTWCNICATHSRSGGSSDLKLYVNGIFVSTNILGATLNPNDNSSNVTIGRRFNAGASSGSTFQGNISLIQIYNRTLSQQEILQNYNATKKRYGL